MKMRSRLTRAISWTSAPRAAQDVPKRREIPNEVEGPVGERKAARIVGEHKIDGEFQAIPQRADLPESFVVDVEEGNALAKLGEPDAVNAIDPGHAVDGCFEHRLEGKPAVNPLKQVVQNQSLVHDAESFDRLDAHANRSATARMPVPTGKSKRRITAASSRPT
ncbi:MAG: hypothetical protein KatS3mg060_1755 [Dehalococcoidia bacterium]|nr:MAG: hypothetical protein KatS3mg060_1755 [Dehalococcoidia bacterium]